MDALGKITGESTFIESNLIEDIKVKRGFFKTTVTLRIEGQPLIIKPNNICIGMPYHKESLVEMAKKFG